MMNGIHVLNKMFGYDTPIPNAPVTRSFRIGVYSSGYKRTDKDEERVAQKRPVKDPNALKPSEKRVLKMVLSNDGTTASTAAQKTGWTQNHCSIILTLLFKRGLVRRVQRYAPHIRFYEYFKNDPT